MIIKTFIIYMAMCAHLQSAPGNWSNYQQMFGERAKVLVYNKKIQTFLFV